MKKLSIVIAMVLISQNIFALQQGERFRNLETKPVKVSFNQFENSRIKRERINLQLVVSTNKSKFQVE